MYINQSFHKTFSQAYIFFAIMIVYCMQIIQHITENGNYFTTIFTCMYILFQKYILI